MTIQTQVTSGHAEIAGSLTSTGLLIDAGKTALPIKEKTRPESLLAGWKSNFELFQSRYFISKATVVCFVYLLLAQLVVASSTIWLSFLSTDIEVGQSFGINLIFYLSALVLCYFPESLAVVSCNKWKLAAFTSLIDRFISSRKNDPVAWNNQALKDETLSILNGEGQATLNAMIEHVYNCMYYVLNVALNIIAITIFIDAKYALAYVVSLVFIVCIMRYNTKKQRGLAQNAQGARIHLGQSLLSIWDNVLLGNKYSFNLWHNQAKDRLNQMNRLNHSSMVFNQWLTISVSLLIFIPSIVVSVHALLVHQHEPLALTALILTLPRVFLVLSYTQLVLSYTSQWNVHKAKLQMIENILKPPQFDEEALKKRISWSKLSFAPPLPLPLKYELSNKNLFAPLEMLAEKLYPAGRFTLRGPNGSGKSTLLMCIKNQVKEQCFYLPTHHHLTFASNQTHASTGESLKHQLQEIQENVDVKVILLDEWDANLDETNCRELSLLIDTLAKERCVIEVRHRS